MYDIVSHSGRGEVTREGRTYPVEYELTAARTYRLRITGTIRAEMDAFPCPDDLHVADLKLQDGKRIRIIFQNVNPVAGTGTFYLNMVNS